MLKTLEITGKILIVITTVTLANAISIYLFRIVFEETAAAIDCILAKKIRGKKNERRALDL